MAQDKYQNFMIKTQKDYIKLLDFLGQMLASDKQVIYDSVERTEIFNVIKGLVNKYFNHLWTILYLTHGTNQDLPSFRSILVDYASIDVLTRASIEAFLVFHHIFSEPKTKDDKEFKYYIYKIGGLADRENIPTRNEENKVKHEAEKKELNQLREKIQCNENFRKLTIKEQKKILGGSWRLPSWTKIAIGAGLSEIIAKYMYSLLCGYAHSSFLSVIQAIEAQTKKNEQDLIIGSILILNLVTAIMIKEYSLLFPQAYHVLCKEQENGQIIDWWIQLGHTLNTFPNDNYSG